MESFATVVSRMIKNKDFQLLEIVSDLRVRL